MELSAVVEEERSLGKILLVEFKMQYIYYGTPLAGRLKRMYTTICILAVAGEFPQHCKRDI
jgi:hypothetical protein